ncbi:hypothetical protein HD806DRAFT_546707 [Xylariaceae sp. AK1471]|nr:hypothetical protein HD806DRAFT_546707 [Xylariaceae sp. AK1471]
MESIAALGVAANILQFIQYGLTIVREAKHLKENQGMPNAALEQSTYRLKAIVHTLGHQIPAHNPTEEQRMLTNLSCESLSLSNELLELLGSFKAQTPNSYINRTWTAIKNRHRAKEIADLEAKLERCKGHILLQLSSLARQETLDGLNQVIRNEHGLDMGFRGLKSTVDKIRSALIDAQCTTSRVIDLIDRFDKAIVTAQQENILSILRFPGMYERYDDISPARFCTFDWLLDEALPLDEIETSSRKDKADSPSLLPNRYTEQGLEARKLLINWLQKESGVFHVCGKPGSGKSVLMKYLCGQPQFLDYLKVWAGGSKVTLGTFFIWAPGTLSQKRFPGLHRGLVHSLLSSSQELIPIAFPDLWKGAIPPHQAQTFLNHQDVQQAFDNILESTRNSSSHKIVLLIDGLDEFDDDLTDLVRTLFQWVERCPASLKILVSSREWNIFDKAFSNCPRLRLHEVTRHDIDLLISGRLDPHQEFLQFDHFERSSIKMSIAQKAEGVFLWVSLVLRVVVDGLLSGNSLPHLLQKLDDCPPELEQLFSHLLGSIHRHDREWAFRAVSLVQFMQTKRLTFSPIYLTSMPLVMWSFLGEYYKDKASALRKPVHVYNSDKVQHRMSLARRMIYGHCKGFLEIVSPRWDPDGRVPFNQYRVQLIHRSISEFLRKPEIQSIMQPHIADFNIPDCIFQTFFVMLKAAFPIDFFARASDNFPVMLPYSLWNYLQELLFLLLSADSKILVRTFQALDSLGPIMRQRYREATKIFQLKPIPRCQWNSLGLCLALSVHFYEFWDWKFTPEHGVVVQLLSQTYRLFPASFHKRSLSLTKQRGVHKPETRLFQMWRCLSAQGYDWNKPMDDHNDWISNTSDKEDSDDIPLGMRDLDTADRDDGLRVCLSSQGEPKPKDNTGSSDNKIFFFCNIQSQSTWQYIFQTLLHQDHMRPHHIGGRMIDFMLREGVDTEIPVLQFLHQWRDLKEKNQEARVPFIEYCDGVAQKFASGSHVWGGLVPVSAPVYHCAQQNNWVVRFWDIIRMGIPDLFDYYVQVASSPDTVPPSDALETAFLDTNLIYGFHPMMVLLDLTQFERVDA